MLLIICHIKIVKKIKYMWSKKLGGLFTPLMIKRVKFLSYGECFRFGCVFII